MSEPAAPERRPPASKRPEPGGARSLVEALNFAFEGIIHVLRTQRNMRVHVAVGAVVLALALILGVSRAELVALFIVIALVMVAEMFNTAIEAAIDVATSSFDPRAKIAKDVAAGAVLVTAVMALTVGFLIFEDRIANPSSDVIEALKHSPVYISVIAFALTLIAVIATKAVTGRGTPMRGGLPSGHAALAFGGWAAIVFITATYAHHVLIITIALAMALLVAQSRVEAGIHSTVEVIYGAILGVLITLIIFNFWG